MCLPGLCLIIRGEERQEGKWEHTVHLGWTTEVEEAGAHAQEGRMEERHDEPMSHPAPPPNPDGNSPQKGTFITLNDSSWAQGKHLFQSLSRSRMTVSEHQPQSQEPARQNLALWWALAWYDLSSHHKASGTHKHSTHLSGSQANPKRGSAAGGKSLLTSREGGETWKYFSPLAIDFRSQFSTLDFASSESRSS